MLLLLKLVAKEGKPLSEIWKPLKQYFHSGEINFEVSNAKAIIAKLKQRYTADATDTSELDGLRIAFENGTNEDWWFNVRPSNTEPLLRLNLEAKSEKTMKKRRDELSSIITEETKI